VDSVPAARLSAFALDLYRRCRELDADRYQAWAAERLKAEIPFDGGKWVSAHMTPAAPVLHSVALFNRPHEMHLDYERIKQHDVVAFEVVAKSGTAILFNSLRTRPDFAADYVRYLAKWRTTHAISCAIVDHSADLLVGVGLWRESLDDPFTEDERCFLEAAMPHLVETHAINRLMHMLRNTQPRNAAHYSNAIADRQARLQVAPQDFVALVRREWPGWRGNRLPAELQHLVADAQQPRFVGREVLFRALAADDLLLVQARTRRAADELSPRELQVARLASAGLTYSRIAQRLQIATATVRTHLSAVYGKLRIRKQAELVAALEDAG
jgi:DNA-binding CsgD family transcriptional regulator